MEYLKSERKDLWHKKAKEIRQELINKDCTFWVSDFVVVEIANSFSRINLREIAIKIVESILKSKEIKLIRIDTELFNESWALYKKRYDKEWGLTDCTSLTIMSKYGITNAFTNDHHFEQAGFQILLK